MSTLVFWITTCLATMLHGPLGPWMPPLTSQWQGGSSGGSGGSGGSGSSGGGASGEAMADLMILLAWLVGAVVVLVIVAFFLRKWLLGGTLDGLGGGPTFSVGELRTLRDQGLMNQDEFDRAKARLVAESRMPPPSPPPDASLLEAPPSSSASGESSSNEDESKPSPSDDKQ